MWFHQQNWSWLKPSISFPVILKTEEQKWIWGACKVSPWKTVSILGIEEHLVSVRPSKATDRMSMRGIWTHKTLFTKLWYCQDFAHKWLFVWLWYKVSEKPRKSQSCCQRELGCHTRYWEGGDELHPHSSGLLVYFLPMLDKFFMLLICWIHQATKSYQKLNRFSSEGSQVHSGLSVPLLFPEMTDNKGTFRYTERTGLVSLGEKSFSSSVEKKSLKTSILCLYYVYSINSDLENEKSTTI